MRVNILKEAYEDIRNGLLFYDAQESGVGQYFSSTVFADMWEEFAQPEWPHF